MLFSVITVVYFAQSLPVFGPAIPYAEFVGEIPYSVLYGADSFTLFVITDFICPLKFAGFKSQYCVGKPLLFLSFPKNIAA